jgi:prolyl-tRNA synthetase
MRYSNLFSKTSNDLPAEEMSKNAQLLIKAGFVHKTMAGVYSYLPLGLRVLNKIENIVRQNMIAIGSQEIFMNSLHPKKWWQDTNRWDNVDVLFKLNSQTSTEYALACSHEEQVTPIMKQFIKSFKDLPITDVKNGIWPLSVFQIQTKFRDELRSKSGLLRGREFRMKDMYDFHQNQESLQAYYEEVKKAYLKSFSQMGLDAYIVQASGGMFTENLSHEFQVICSAGEDEIVYSPTTGFACNVEVLEELKSGQKIPDDLQKGISAEVGNIFQFGDKYTKNFGVTFTDQDNKQRIPVAGAHGIGTSRCMAVIAELYNDKNGLIWPESVTPFNFYLITNLESYSKDSSLNEKITKIAREVYSGSNALTRNFMDDVLWDDRMGVSIGKKLTDADLIGIPWQIVISKKSLENGGIELINRKTKESKIVFI